MQDFSSFYVKLNEALKYPKIQIKEKHILSFGYLCAIIVDEKKYMSLMTILYKNSLKIKSWKKINLEKFECWLVFNEERDQINAEDIWREWLEIVFLLT